MDILLVRGERLTRLGDITCVKRQKPLRVIIPDEHEVRQLLLKQSVDEAWKKACHLLLKDTEGIMVREPKDWKASSATSAALYPAFWDLAPEEQGGLLLQLLPPSPLHTMTLTSRHHHKCTTERFYPLLGQTEIWTSETQDWNPLTWRHEVPIGCGHQLRARGLAVNIIRMDTPLPFLDAEGKPNMEDHFYG